MRMRCVHSKQQKPVIAAIEPFFDIAMSSANGTQYEICLGR